MLTEKQIQMYDSCTFLSESKITRSRRTTEQFLKSNSSKIKNWLQENGYEAVHPRQADKKITTKLRLRLAAMRGGVGAIKGAMAGINVTLNPITIDGITYISIYLSNDKYLNPVLIYKDKEGTQRAKTISKHFVEKL